MQHNTPQPTYWQSLTIALLIAVSFSQFIYIEHYHLHNTFTPLFNTLFALLAYYLLLRAKKLTLFLSGCFIALLWFYWMGYSFQYTNTGFMLPIVDAGVALGYGAIFLFLALGTKAHWRALLLLSLSFFEPMDFNWLTFELPFIDSIFGVQTWHFAIILTALALPIERKPFALISLLLLTSLWLIHLLIPLPPPQMPNLAISMHNTFIDQGIKWKKEQRKKSVIENFRAINRAIKQNKELIILPESAFALYLDTNPTIKRKLQQLSHHISIVSGVLYHDDGKNYNVSILAQDGKIYIAKKMVLVPFGEYVPLPKFAQKIISDTFFNGVADFIGANKPTDFMIHSKRFRSAICYEATCKELYEGDPAFMIAISNNAWFIPSIEPTLQHLLLRYYATLHHTTIYHVANGAGGAIITPNP